MIEMLHSSETVINSNWSLTTEEFVDRLTFRLVKDGMTAVQFNFFANDQFEHRKVSSGQRLRDELLRHRVEPKVIRDAGDRIFAFFRREVL
jgi:hypothetical protein